jgi:hypothetical protein
MMVKSYSLEDVQTMATAPGAVSPRSFSLEDVTRMQADADRAHDQASRDFIVKRETTDLAYGMRRGMRDVLNTGAELLASGWDKLAGSNEAERVRALNKAERESATAGRPVTPGSVTGYVGGNTLMTMPLLGLAGSALQRTGVPMLQGLGTAIQSGGMGTGAVAPATTAARVGDMALRSAGGAVNGYVSAGLADPSPANFGAAVGAVLPPAFQGGQKLLEGATRAVRSVRLPAEVRTARDIAGIGGADVRNLDELATMRDLLRQEGPQIIPGPQTVPEILQNPGISQLQRSVQAVQPAPFVARNAEREAARRGVLEQIAPIGNRSDVAQEVGTNIAEYALPAHEAARKRVTAAFESVDPFGQSRVNLPISQMQAAKDKFLGPGTFGSGRSAQQAIDEATRIGTETLPAVRPMAAGRQPEHILQAVRKLGGISPNSAGGMNREIVELGRKQTGTTGLVSANGRSIDEVAELMHERGFIGSPDPAELLDAMRGGLSGRASYGADLADDAFRSRLERSMGDVPQAVSQPKPVTFEELQNLRSSITEKWAEARRFGNAREAAALDAQRRAIDSTLENLAAGKGQAGEYFAPDMVRNFKEARQLHAAKEQRFKTGPQAGLFRQGGDGLPVAQGGEIPRRFFNGNGSQVADAQAFRRLVQDDPRMMAELRSYAVSDAASQVDRMGNLTNAKFNRWIDSRQGAIGATFTEQQRAWLKAIAEDLRRADLAENLGRSTGSDTMQKASSMLNLGLLDNPALGMAAGRVPGGRFALDFLRGPAKTARAQQIGGLLLDPPKTAGLLDQYIQSQALPITGLLGNPAIPGLLHSSPLLLSGGATR